jgi:hypothetical protein
MIHRAVAAIALAMLAAPAGAAVLYKSIDANGTVQFSDLPPDRGVDAKKIVVPESTSAVPGATRPADVVAAMPAPREPALLTDEALQRASMQVDMAEHALAIARRPLWEIADPMRLEATRMNRSDRERVDFYQKNLKVAKQQLADLLRTKQRTEATMTADAGAPIYGPLGPIVRR